MWEEHDRCSIYLFALSSRNGLFCVVTDRLIVWNNRECPLIIWLLKFLNLISQICVIITIYPCCSLEQLGATTQGMGSTDWTMKRLRHKVAWADHHLQTAIPEAKYGDPGPRRKSTVISSSPLKAWRGLHTHPCDLIRNWRL